MKGIKIVCVGRVKEEFFKEGIGHYVKEIRKKYPMDILECPDESTPDSCPESVERQIRDTEGERILNKIKDDEYVVALCIDGKHYSTQEWGDRMNRIFFAGTFTGDFCDWWFAWSVGESDTKGK